jgi:hypothetical protein
LILSFLQETQEIYFVTSELLIKKLKKSANEIKNKIHTNLILMFGQVGIDDVKKQNFEILRIVLSKYCQILLSKNFNKLQKR